MHILNADLVTMSEIGLTQRFLRIFPRPHFDTLEAVDSKILVGDMYDHIIMPVPYQVHSLLTST